MGSERPIPPPPSGIKILLDFMQFPGKFGKTVCWRHPGELVSPPQVIPGSVNGQVKVLLSRLKVMDFSRLQIPRQTFLCGV